MENEKLKSRPSHRDPRILQKLAADLHKEMREQHDIHDFGEEDYLKVLQYTHSHRLDGYAFVRYMDKHWGLDGDANMVYNVDGVLSQAGLYQRELLAEWVKENNIQPQYKVGQRVIFKRHRGYEVVEVSGLITDIYHEEATYNICREEDGQVPGLSAWVIQYEDVLRLAEPTSAA